jgi:hypothetical protein
MPSLATVGHARSYRPRLLPAAAALALCAMRQHALATLGAFAHRNKRRFVHGLSVQQVLHAVGLQVAPQQRVGH